MIPALTFVLGAVWGTALHALWARRKPRCPKCRKTDMVVKSMFPARGSHFCWRHDGYPGVWFTP